MKREFAFGIALGLSLVAQQVHADESCASIFSLRTIKIARAAGATSAELTPDWLAQAAQETKAESPATEQLQDALQSLGMSKIAINLDVVRDKPKLYENELPKLSISDQQRSGRCWIFAGCNVMRTSLLAAKKAPADFEFSQAYYHFFNILEKANKQLVIAANRVRPGMSQKEINEQLKVGGTIGDGGWVQWFNFLVEKYGAVPQSAMPETASSRNTGGMTEQVEWQMGIIVRDMLAALDTAEGRAEPVETALEIKNRGMKEIYRILAAHLGDPAQAQSFQFVVPGKDDAKPEVRTFTAREFADKYVEFNPRDYVVVGAYPQLPVGKRFAYTNSSIAATGPNTPSHVVSFINVGTERMKALVKASIDAKSAVWFAADIRKATDVTTGIMHPQIYSFGTVLGLPEGGQGASLSRSEQIVLGLSEPDHAMALTGYTNDGKWLKVDNSWGAQYGDQGEFHMHDSWFNQYVFEVTIHRNLLSPEEQALLDSRPRLMKESDIE